jgi:hypothetical protein
MPPLVRLFNRFNGPIGILVHNRDVNTTEGLGQALNKGPEQDLFLSNGSKLVQNEIDGRLQAPVIEHHPLASDRAIRFCIASP